MKTTVRAIDYSRRCEVAAERRQRMLEREARFKAANPALHQAIVNRRAQAVQYPTWDAQLPRQQRWAQWLAYAAERPIVVNRRGFVQLGCRQDQRAKDLNDMVASGLLRRHRSGTFRSRTTFLVLPGVPLPSWAK